MKQTDLDLLIRCQKKIKEAMGRGKLGDRGYYKNTICHITDMKDDIFRVDGVVIDEKDIVIAPPLYDIDRPERSLIGMLKNKLNLHNDAEPFWTCVTWRDDEDENQVVCHADNPYIAMLLALCEQWEV